MSLALAVQTVAQGKYSQAESLYGRALVINEKALGPDHPDVALNLSNLAYLNVTQSQFAVAEPLHRRSLAIREKALGADHPFVAETLGNLAGVKGARIELNSMCWGGEGAGIEFIHTSPHPTLPTPPVRHFLPPFPSPPWVDRAAVPRGAPLPPAPLSHKTGCRPRAGSGSAPARCHPPLPRRARNGTVPGRPCGALIR